MIVRTSIATIILSIALIIYSIVGFIAVRLEVQSLWLPLWFSVFQTVYLLAFVILPAGLLESYFTRRSQTSIRLRTGLAVADIVVPSLLFIVVLYVQNRMVSEGKRRAIQAQGSTAGIEAVTPERLPSSPLRTLAGKEISIDDLIRGSRIAVLVFWASYDFSWSPNIRTAESVFEKYKSRGCVVIGINEQEDRIAVANFVKEKGVSFPIVLDTNGAYMQSLHLPGSVEQVLVVDSAGRILEHLPKTREVTERLSSIVEQHLTSP